jgi:hypothetical protein
MRDSHELLNVRADFNINSIFNLAGAREGGGDRIEENNN